MSSAKRRLGSREWPLTQRAGGSPLARSCTLHERAFSICSYADPLIHYLPLPLDLLLSLSLISSSTHAGLLNSTALRAFPTDFSALVSTCAYVRVREEPSRETLVAEETFCRSRRREIRESMKGWAVSEKRVSVGVPMSGRWNQEGVEEGVPSAEVRPRRATSESGLP